ncbi:hypothetical protein N3K66_003211 [Trichothecium roseum]|uniref:Uncharacterized protein n=1 Tax=Trichothecium roseum TaxID=47278 RepID=A0ACC0V6B5_9HYPO|nr:hypothetical protein N3K66_003211 [Trichothecium roseum]
MVYCGKPSRGCQMCRTRRIKCDETKPTCNQCAKSRRQCPGYKDEFDLVFRNETQATERRAKKANMKAMALKMGKEGIELINSPNETPSSAKTNSPVSPIQLPPEQQASCHFISNFVLLPRQGTTRGFMEYLIPMLKQHKQTTHFKLAFDACALASLGNRVGTGCDFENQALTKYTKALSATYGALQDPEMAKQDSTLAAILLLGLFENISAKQLGTLAWGSHTEGAVQLVKARGRKQLRTKVGLMLFIAVRTQMIIHTLSSGKAPAMGVEWWMNDAVKDSNAADCQRLSIRVGEVRAEVNRLLTALPRSPENVEVMFEMLRNCQGLDQECAQWVRDLPSAYDWHTVAWEDQPPPDGDYSRAETYPGRVDAYQDLYIVSVWNMMRASRIILASLIVRTVAWICAPLDYRTTPEYATSARTCTEAIADIIASVPYQLGYFSNRKHLLDGVNLSSYGCGDEDALKGLPGYFLTWPLTCIYGQDYTLDSQRAWVRGRLEFIGNQLGVRYAHILAKLNLRIPSMLIRRDGLMAKPYSAAPNFVKLISQANATETLEERYRGAMEQSAKPAVAEAQSVDQPISKDGVQTSYRPLHTTL